MKILTRLLGLIGALFVLVVGYYIGRTLYYLMESWGVTAYTYKFIGPIF